MCAKVIFFVHTTIGYGANRSLIELIDYLRTCNIECVVLGADELELSIWLRERGVKYFNINSRLSTYPNINSKIDLILWPIRFLYQRLRNILAVYNAVRIVKRENPSILHTNIGPLSVGFWVSKILDIPHVWHVREYQKEDFNLNFFPSRKVFKYLLARSEKCIFITPELQKLFANPKCSSLIYDSVSVPQTVTTTGRIIADEYFLFCGRIETAKGVELIAEAFSIFMNITKKPIKLVFLGNGDVKFLKRFTNKLQELNIADHVIFLGFRDDVKEIMSAAAAVIVASKSEGFGRITVEAMLSRCLVIGKDTGGTLEIFRLAKKGNLPVNSFSSVDGLVECMLRVQSLNEIEKTNILNGFERFALEQFGQKRHGESVLQIYKDALQNVE